jgi:hypothetical protein
MFDVCSTVDAFNYPRYFHGRKETAVFYSKQRFKHHFQFCDEDRDCVHARDKRVLIYDGKTG